VSLVQTHPRSIAAHRLGALLAAVLVVVALAAPVTAGPAGPTKLSDPSVTPPTAQPGAAVTLEVTYRNREGSPPDYVRAVIDGETNDMSVVGTGEDWKHGARFRLVVTLPLGEHAVVFIGRDRERFTDELNGGTISIVAPPTPKTSPPSPTAPPATPKPPRTVPPTATPAPPTGDPAPTPRVSATPRPSATPGVAATARPGTPGTPGWAAAGEDPATPDASTDGASASPGDPADPTAEGPDSGDTAALPVDGSAGAGPTGPTANDRSGGGSGGPPGWGALANDLAALGIGSNPFTEFRAVQVFIATSGAVTVAFAFLMFGKRRRDEAPPEPDEVLRARAARGTGVAAGADLVPELAAPSGPAAPTIDPDAHLPRWRRPSLIEARKKDPTREAVVGIPPMSFDHGDVAPVGGGERRLIRYTIVRLLDAPDELRAGDLGALAQGDEIQVLSQEGVYRFVLCPDGRRGWLHRMTLGDVVGEARAPSAVDAWWTSGRDGDDVDPDVLTAFMTARGQA
jgi:hypothetical protein